MGGGRRPSPRVVAPAQREDGAPSCPLLPLPPWRELAVLLEPRSHDRESAKCSVPGGFGCGALEGAHRAGSSGEDWWWRCAWHPVFPSLGMRCRRSASAQPLTRSDDSLSGAGAPLAATGNALAVSRQDRGRHLDGHGHRRDWRGSLRRSGKAARRRENGGHLGLQGRNRMLVTPCANPADGVIRTGQRPRQRVRAGEINGTGALEVEQSGKDASQRSADRISPIPVRGSMITAALFAGVGSFFRCPTRARACSCSWPPRPAR